MYKNIEKFKMLNKIKEPSGITMQWLKNFQNTKKLGFLTRIW